MEDALVNPIQNCSDDAVRSSSILDQSRILSKIGNWPPRPFLFVERLGNVCVIRHQVFLDGIGASYVAWQPMAGCDDMTRLFGLEREESTRKCFVENDWDHDTWEFLGSVAQSMLERLGSNGNPFI